eukprot:Em0020g323a
MCSRLKSELCMFYLDDGTLGGLLSDVLHDVEMIKKEAGIVGLELNPQKSEVVAAASSELAHMILPTNMQPTQLSYVDEALVIWSQGCQEQPLTGVAAHHQKSWDSLRLFSMADTLLKNTTDELNRARLLAASWLRMDDTTIRISMGLRLGIEIIFVNTVELKCLKPSGLYRSDGKRPDGITTVPWKCGQLLVWDATCPDTYAPSYSTIAAQQAGAVGQQAEDKKAQKYKHLSSHHFFTPVAIETSGVYGPRTADFLKELGHRLRQVSGEASRVCNRLSGYSGYSDIRKNLSVRIAT